MLAKMIVQSATVRGYDRKDKSGKPTGERVRSLELVGMELPEGTLGHPFAGALRVNLPAPEGAEEGGFGALVAQVVKIEIVGLRVSQMGTEQIIEFKGRLPENGNNAPLPTLPTATKKAEKAALEVKA